MATPDTSTGEETAASQTDNDSAQGASASLAQAAMQGGGSLDQIREILFGVEKAEYDRRFSQLEARLAEQGAALASELGSRLDALAASVEQKLEALGAALKAERGERADGDKQLTRELKQAGAGFDKQLARLGADVERKTEALATQIGEEATRLGEQAAAGDVELARRHAELTVRHEELAAALAAEAQSLGEAKADRATVAALLRDMADRLGGDPETAK